MEEQHQKVNSMEEFYLFSLLFLSVILSKNFIKGNIASSKLKIYYEVS